MNPRHLCVALPLGLFAGSAFAHPGHDSASGLSILLAHLFDGMDHPLAMLASAGLLGLAVIATRHRLRGARR